MVSAARIGGAAAALHMWLSDLQQIMVQPVMASKSEVRHGAMFGKAVHGLGVYRDESFTVGEVVDYSVHASLITLSYCI
jgi:hypothetical protein